MSFPQYGKNISAFSTLWKNIFHSVDSGGASAPTHNTCTRCGHKWYPRTPERPRVCPKCKSPYWDKPRKVKGTK